MLMRCAKTKPRESKVMNKAEPQVIELGFTVGLPLSGKTTFARILSEKKGHVIVCPDTVRYALHGKQFIGLAEPFVWAIAQTMVRTLLMEGHSVIVDATNTTKKRRKMWIDIAKEQNVNYQAYVIYATREECHERNAQINRLDRSIIDRMADQWEEPTKDEIGMLR